MLDLLTRSQTLRRPRIRAHYQLRVVPGEGVFLLSQERQIVLEGALFERLCPWLDGRSTGDEIAAALAGRLRPAEVYYGIELLRRSGHLVEMEGRTPSDDDSWWSDCGLDPGEAASRLRSQGVALRATGSLSPEALRAALARDGVQVDADAGPLIVAVGDYLDPTLGEINRECLQSGRVWMPVRPRGNPILIGPVFRPGATGCWECLAQRLRMNREYELVARGGEPLPDASCRSEAVAAALVAAKVSEWIAGGQTNRLERHVLSMDLLNWEAASHEFLRLPFCHACGRVPQLDTAATPIELQRCPKTGDNDGGERSMAPAETLRRYARHVSPLTGIIRSLRKKPIAGADDLHVYEAGTNRATPPRSLADMRAHFRTNSLGKGTTEAQSKASALCEAIERYSGGFQGYEARRVARLKDLGEQAVDPRLCMLYSQQQYARREWWNAKESRFNVVPMPFDAEAPLEWSPLWSLTRKASRYLPTAMLYYGHPTPRSELMFKPCSNGCAAGNTVEEAILQGLLELVERDAIALWWYNRLQRPGVALDSFDDPYIRRLERKLAAWGRDMWAVDLTSDLNIPVFGVFSRRTAAEPERIVMGFGSHLDARIALLRAMTEMTQMLAWVSPLELGVADAPPIRDIETMNWLATAQLRTEPYLLAAAGPRRARNDYPTLSGEGLREDLLFCVAAIERKGMEVMVLDQTRPDVGLPVVKVVVPGLRHCHARFAPGRLYDVPLQMGWMDRALEESQLNPVNVFL